MGIEANHTDKDSSHQEKTHLTVDDVSLYIGSEGKNNHPGSDNMDVGFGRNGGDRLSGDAMDDDLLGGRGDDRLTGKAGMDHLDGGAGNDRLKGGAEADTLRGGTGNDHLREGSGHGDLEGGEGDDVLVGGPGGDAFVVSPDSGHDIIKDFAAGPGMLDHLALRDIEPEDLRFQDTKDGALISWNGGESSVLLQGIVKADLAQDDFMFTDDRKVITPIDADANQVTATEFIKNEGNQAEPPQSGDADKASKQFDFDEFTVKIGSANADTFKGTSDRDYFIGRAGDDLLFGESGDDDLWGGKGNDTLSGGNGQDHLKGEDGNDELHGGMMADSLMGAGGNDALYAGAGHDMLEGGMGSDTLDGGDGADAFIVAPDSGNDVVIGGFDAGPGAFDHIAFRNILPAEVTVADTARSGDNGVLVSWNTDTDSEIEGSIFLAGLAKSQMAQDDFMFNADDGLRGRFENDPAITASGSEYIFQNNEEAAANPATDYFFVS
ncbi:Ca2+-binding RTX toxin-like protein [Skermanella aerolata]|uniref:calcium-binding protein n=1 Tax=Skermanella aerolata TaxID=393310 RepID=UPI003D240851